jgi:DmsE family decaheme c-type cytochrome
VRYSPGFLTLALLALGAIPLLAQPARPGADASSPYVGSTACQGCHEQGYRRFATTKMGKILLEAPRNDTESRGCESCHGPGREHMEAEVASDAARAAGTPSTGPKGSEFIIRFGKNAPLPIGEQSARCLQCHEKGQRLFWKGSNHESRGLGCTTCHQIHPQAQATMTAAEGRYTEPLSGNRLMARNTQMEVCFGCHPMRRAQLQRSSHMPVREGKVTCTNCHNPHGSPNPKLLLTATVNETCYKCHAERRGPFLFEHPPVMENCVTCHDAHGSNNPQLLKVRQPRLCNDCHAVSGHNVAPQLATNRFVFNRSCTNCHSAIHGSNSPAGSRFQR